MNTTFASTPLGRACVLLAAAAFALPACAGEPAPLTAQELSSVPLADAAVVLLPIVGTAKPEPATLAVGGATVQAVDLEQLDHERGRADTVLNDTKLGGEVANNSAVNVNTGANTIDAGSFANMSGIPVVIQNSGANVLIQNATVVNLQFQ